MARKHIENTRKNGSRIRNVCVNKHSDIWLEPTRAHRTQKWDTRQYDVVRFYSICAEKALYTICAALCGAIVCQDHIIAQSSPITLFYIWAEAFLSCAIHFKSSNIENCVVAAAVLSSAIKRLVAEKFFSYRLSFLVGVSLKWSRFDY